MKPSPFINTTASHYSDEVGITQKLELGHCFSRFLPCMKEDEDYSTIKPNFDSKYTKHRELLIRALRSMSRKLRLTARTYFLGIAYLDDVVSKTEIKEEGLGLVALCCLYISGIFR